MREQEAAITLNVDSFEAGFSSETVKEGEVKVLVPKLKDYVRQSSDYAPSKAPVFYNPVMELNRDIAILAIQAYQREVRKEISICEPLSSSGIRGVRFASEIHGIKTVVINDINERAVKLAEHNVELNNLQGRVTVEHKDANCLLSCHGGPHQRFDVVDLDPFGSPVPYLDSAIRAVQNNGLLAMTATDLAPLCGVHPKACIRKYGGKPLRTEYCHELAIRLLLGCAASSAAKHELGLRVLFSHSTDHYVRAYVQISCGARTADKSLKNLGYILHCFNCLHRETSPSLLRKNDKCPECGSRMDISGPLWIGKILDRQFCELMIYENTQRALRNSARIANLLSLERNEADAPPTYYVTDKLSSKLSLAVPSINVIIKNLQSSGRSAIPTHFNSLGLKTVAPALEVQKIIKLSIVSKSNE